MMAHREANKVKRRFGRLRWRIQGFLWAFGPRRPIRIGQTTMAPGDLLLNTTGGVTHLSAGAWRLKVDLDSRLPIMYHNTRTIEF
jgi:hypothetical protein